MLKALSNHFGSKSKKRAARAAAVMLYDTIVDAAREPSLYVEAGVPDTVDGRFDSLALHEFLLMDRMSGREGWTPVGEALADRTIADLDQSLREMGIGDMSIGKKVKAAATQLYGRFDVYWGALRAARSEDALKQVLARNLFRGCEPSPEHLELMEAYVLAQRAFLATLSDDEILAGRLRYLPAAESLGMREKG